MPRGNDPDARRDFLERHGTLNPDLPTTNAEELIRAHSVSQSRAVAKASLLPVNNTATDELDLDSLDDKAGGHVVAAAVRGNAVVCVVEDETGRTYKTVVPHNDRYVAPAEDAAEEVAREQSMADIDLQAALMEQQEKHAEAIAELRKEFDEKLGEIVAEKQEESQERVRAAQERAADSSDDSGEAPETQTSESDPAEGGGAKTRKTPSEQKKTSSAKRSPGGRKK